jgi:hypothetical protein
MDESKIALPNWLPWATTAILAALVACSGELLLIERTRNELLREETAVAASALKSSQNQLEAERIVSGRELSRLGHDLSVEFLSPVPGSPSHTSGAAVWNPGQGRGVLTVYDLNHPASPGEFQLWVFDANSKSASAESSCALFASPATDGAFQMPFDMVVPESDGLRFCLVFGKKGGAASLDEALREGSIVLASQGR